MRQMTLWNRINGAKNEAEELWAAQLGMKVYNKWANIANKFIIPVYNWIWDHLYPNTEDYEVEHPNYDRIYKFIADRFCNIVSFLMGGYDFKNKRKVYVNVLCKLSVNDNGELETDDLIYVKNFKKD